MNSEIAEIYGNKVRIRVCGLCWGPSGTLLMVKHKMGTRDFWAPPGGGVDFGEFLEDALKREFFEETTIRIVPGRFMFGCEFIDNPLHAIELFFEVEKAGGTVATGYDPEMKIIEDVRFLSMAELKKAPVESLHGIFTKVDDLADLRQLSGFHRI